MDKSNWNCWYQHSLSPTAPTIPDKISKLPNAPSTCRPAFTYGYTITTSSFGILNILYNPSKQMERFFPTNWREWKSFYDASTSLHPFDKPRYFLPNIYALSYTAVNPYPGIGFFELFVVLPCEHRVRDPHLITNLRIMSTEWDKRKRSNYRAVVIESNWGFGMTFCCGAGWALMHSWGCWY